jgi:AcrR family transcriptional regulator
MTPTRQYTKVARAEAEERTRNALLDAAERSFFEGTVQRKSLAVLAEDAGTTKQTLLRHFGSRKGLTEAAYARGAERVRDHRMAAPTDDVGGAIENLLDHYEELGDKALAMSALSASDFGADFAELGKRFHREWVDHAFGSWLDAASKAGRKLLRGALIALCDVQTWAILSHDLGYSRAEIQATLMTAIERLLEESP